MDDLPSSIRLQQSSAKARTGEELETMGKEAASKYVRGTFGTLTESVVETVKSAGLSPEQVRRVVEFANIDAFNKEFQKEAGGHRVVEFKGGPASFPEVLRDLNDGGTTEIDKHAFDYSLPPPDVTRLSSKNEDRLGLENAKLASAFAVEEVPLPYAEPLREALDAKSKLAGAEAELASTLSELESQYYGVVEGLFHSVKQAALEGTSLGQIVAAWGSVVGRPEFVKSAFINLSPRLVENGVFSSLAAIGDSLMKTASIGVVNSEHPIMVNFCDFCEVLTKLAETRLAHAEVSAGLDTLSTFLKTAAGLGSIPGAIEKGWGAATAAAQRAAPVAAGAVEKAVPYLPHAALGYGALRAVASSPVQRGLAYVPGTPQSAARQYYSQQGM
jgi:hypothetical protein